MKLARFDDLRSASLALADELVAVLRRALAARGTASLVLSGGRTPLPLFGALRDADLQWDRVHVTLSDDRWVPETDPGSNAALLRNAWRGGRADAARIWPLHDGGVSAAGSAAGVWRSLAAVPRPFDAMLLGMGEDGHFASLFPGNADLETALDPMSPPACVAMQAPVAPFERISLNLSALLQSRRLFLLIAGKAKMEMLQAARRPVDAAARTGVAPPIRALLAQDEVEVETYWAP